ncbi:unnamed protein product [Penicillium salamii]|uniref:Uncharacterized protein n=1 Tax=Penicillium salamii TaxID=1612424 RepID=A0A9W4NAX8_9EURO|nr:unnamed protein product [Penicillium salamii]CAG8044934.1 unnamed protein product [Penicillium salamii]CAG8338225.1 unnamed protein product [Penicillium salamii]CAG8346449.1 unnamed protein product [Penicillium salamii]CAG8346513.1 unnamed protein product [Penicillium salamii]
MVFDHRCYGLFRRNGVIIPDLVSKKGNQRVYWVSVDFSIFNLRVADNGSAGLMRLMAEQIRSGVAVISKEPLHHEKPAFLSLPVVGAPDLPRKDILEAAAENADWRHEEIVCGRLTLDDDNIIACLRPLEEINGA